MMKLHRTHIPDKILESRKARISEEKLLESIHNFLHQDDLREHSILETVQTSKDEIPNRFIFDKLQTNRIFHIDDIEKTCIQYRLRFLNSSLFKANLPYEAVIKIKQLENEHDTIISGFKIMAPASAFKLKNADDPLLFAPMGNNYYYLIHSWGRDLHPIRKLLVWPVRHLENFMFFLFIMSFLLTAVVPAGLFSKEQTTSEFIILFFFMFKWVTGLAIFYGFKYGKNFSAAIWDSTYINA